MTPPFRDHTLRREGDDASYNGFHGTVCSAIAARRHVVRSGWDALVLYWGLPADPSRPARYSVIYALLPDR